MLVTLSASEDQRSATCSVLPVSRDALVRTDSGRLSIACHYDAE